MDNRVSFDKVAVEYDFVSEIFNNNNFFLANLSKHKSNALDIGCGSGILMNALSEVYDNVYGIDISEEMLDIARFKRGKDNLHYINMNAENIRFDKKFDLIVSRTTLHHISNKVELINKMKTLLSEGGKIVIVDNVSEVETPKRILNIAGAYLELIPNLLKYGYKSGIRIFKHSTSKEWLDHLSSDVYLSEEDTKQLYERNLEGCSTHRLACFLGVVWTKN